MDIKEDNVERSCKTCLYSGWADRSICPPEWEFDCDACHPEFLGKEISNCSSYVKE